MPLRVGDQRVGQRVAVCCSHRERFSAGSEISTIPVENLVGKILPATEKIRLHSSLPRFEHTFVQFRQVLSLQTVEKFFPRKTASFHELPPSGEQNFHPRRVGSGRYR
jgi:hypothetical protein